MCNFLFTQVGCESVKWMLHWWHEGVRDTVEHYENVLFRIRCGRLIMCLRLSVLRSASLACSLSLSFYHYSFSFFSYFRKGKSQWTASLGWAMPGSLVLPPTIHAPFKPQHSSRRKGYTAPKVATQALTRPSPISIRGIVTACADMAWLIKKGCPLSSPRWQDLYAWSETAPRVVWLEKEEYG